MRPLHACVLVTALIGVGLAGVQAATLGGVTAKSLGAFEQPGSTSAPTVVGCDSFTGTTGASMSLRAVTTAGPCSSLVWTVHVGTWTLARRPLIVGAIHGLAGSGALTALVLTTLPSTRARLTYMALFGLGSTLSMAALSGLLGWPLARLGAHSSVTRGISMAVGVMSVGLGLFWGYPLVGRIF